MKHRPAYILFFLRASMVLAVPSADAGQTVIIDTNIGDNVYGNGDLPDGSLPVGGAGELLPPDYNTLIINRGTVEGFVYGGYVNNANAVSVTATGNTVTIAGGRVNGHDVYGGYAESDGGSATSTGNAVTINGGMVDTFVSGGYSRNSVLATSSDNAVIINGGEVGDSVFGGNAYSATTGDVTATGDRQRRQGGQ